MCCRIIGLSVPVGGPRTHPCPAGLPLPHWLLRQHATSHPGPHPNHTKRRDSQASAPVHPVNRSLSDLTQTSPDQTQIGALNQEDRRCDRTGTPSCVAACHCSSRLFFTPSSRPCAHASFSTSLHSHRHDTAHTIHSMIRNRQKWLDFHVERRPVEMAIRRSGHGWVWPGLRLQLKAIMVA